MSKATPLTDAQKAIISQNCGAMLDATISFLPGMEGTTIRQIGDYRKRITRESNSEHRKLADHISEYISKNGLPAKYGAVIDYLNYLRERG